MAGYFSLMYLAIATSNWDKLSNVYDLFMYIFDKPDSNFREMSIYKDLLLGFINKDIEKIEVNLNLLESSILKKHRINETLEEKYISINTTALAKLAWMHGMEVKIESDYVPRHLLPHEPLEEYTIPYKFLRDFYRNQGIDWRYDPIHPELQDWENDPENPNRKKGGYFNKLFS